MKYLKFEKQATVKQKRIEECKHPFARKTIFGVKYCPTCEKNVPIAKGIK